jgi:hypothetical protein
VWVAACTQESSNPYKLPVGAVYHEVTIVEPDDF